MLLAELIAANMTIAHQKPKSHSEKKTQNLDFGK